MDLPQTKLTDPQNQFTHRMRSDVYFYSMFIVVGLVPILINGYIWSTDTEERPYHYANLAYATFVFAIGAYHMYMSQAIDQRARQLVADAAASKMMPADVQASALKAIESVFYPVRMRVEVISGMAGLMALTSLVFSGKVVFSRRQ